MPYRIPEQVLRTVSKGWHEKFKNEKLQLINKYETQKEVTYLYEQIFR